MIMTQSDIDKSGRYFPVTDEDLPELPIRKKTFPEDPNVWDYERYNRKPPISKVMVPIGGTFECVKGDRSECIPGESIISVLRRLAEQEGKPVEIREVRPHRWAMWFTILGMVAIFGVGIVLNWVK